jgi:hypothetical protein
VPNATLQSPIGPSVPISGSSWLVTAVRPG